MYYGAVKTCDVANGTGVRVSIFVSGCTNRCEGCFQPETWCFTYGKKYTKETEEQILNALEPAYISGLTVLGGEPFEFENQPELARLIVKVKERYPQKDIWCYTGFVLDKDLIPGGKRYGEYTDQMLDGLDVLVDGRFEKEKKNLGLAFRGSSNQRLIDMRASREAGEIICLKL